LRYGSAGLGNCMGGCGDVDPQIVGYFSYWCDVGLLGMGNGTVVWNVELV
jgi:hypothetical protein